MNGFVDGVRVAYPVFIQYRMNDLHKLLLLFRSGQALESLAVFRGSGLDNVCR